MGTYKLFWQEVSITTLVIHFSRRDKAIQRISRVKVKGRKNAG